MPCLSQANSSMASIQPPPSRLRVAGSRGATAAGARQRPLARPIMIIASNASKPHAAESSTSCASAPSLLLNSNRRNRGSEASTSSPSLPCTRRWHQRLPELRSAVASVALSAAAAVVVSTSTFASAVVAPPPASAAAELSSSSAPPTTSSSRTVPVDRAWLEGLVIEDTRAK